MNREKTHSDKDQLLLLQMEKLVEKKLLETLKAYRWIFSFVLAITVSIAGFLGLKIDSISTMENTIRGVLAQAKATLHTVEDTKREILSEVDGIRFSLEALKAETDVFTDSSHQQIGLIDQKIHQARQLDKEYENLYKASFQRVLSDIQQVKADVLGIKTETETAVANVQTSIQEACNATEDARSVIREWESRKRELIALSSTVSVYVERCSRREPEESKPLHDYKPSFVRLPFSDFSMTVVFTKYKVRKTLNRRTGNPEKYKEIELYITVTDGTGQVIYKNPMLLEERMFREKEGMEPVGIPSTNHTIQADFIYLPPNPLMRIPDFAVLTISANPETVLTAS